MEKHLLVTVSDDASCLYGARFVGSFFRNKAAVKCTLFYVARISDPRTHRGDFARQSDVRNAVEKHETKGERAMKESLRLLCHRGFAEDHIDCKFIFKQFGTVKDIVREGNVGLYDSVVLGRSGLSLFETFLSDSVSREIMEKEIEFPLWICRNPDESRANVLLCADGSEPSLRVADHVAYIIDQEKQHSVTIFHVNTGQVSDLQAMIEKTGERLMKNGLSEERITTKIVESSRVSHNIIKEFREGGYAAIAIGRVGVEKSGLRGWLMGSSTLDLLKDLEKGALWVSW